VSIDHYAGTEARWATDASRVYGPIALELLELGPPSWSGRFVLDAGAGTGVASEALLARKATVVAADLSFDMLSWRRALRPPSTVADVCRLPIASSAVDGTVAAFVLNHLREPDVGLAELMRVTRSGGFLLANVFSAESRSAVRDRVDELAKQAGWRVPDWYAAMKTEIVPLLGGAKRMEDTALRAGLLDIRVEERDVDVGLVEPHHLVDYRFGQAQFTDWLSSLGSGREADLRDDVAEAIRPVMEPYRPTVVFLAARVP